MSENTVELDVEVLAVSERALFVKIEDDVEVWFPLSQIDVEKTDVKFTVGATGTLVVTEWIAKQRGLS